MTLHTALGYSRVFRANERAAKWAWHGNKSRHARMTHPGVIFSPWQRRRVFKSLQLIDHAAYWLMIDSSPTKPALSPSGSRGPGPQVSRFRAKSQSRHFRRLVAAGMNLEDRKSNISRFRTSNFSAVLAWLGHDHKHQRILLVPLASGLLSALPPPS